MLKKQRYTISQQTIQTRVGSRIFVKENPRTSVRETSGDINIADMTVSRKLKTMVKVKKLDHSC